MDITTEDREFHQALNAAVARSAKTLDRVLGPAVAIAVDQICDTCRQPTGYTTRRPHAKVTCDPCFDLQYRYDVDGKEI